MTVCHGGSRSFRGSKKYEVIFGQPLIPAASIQWPTIPRSRHIHPSPPAEPRKPKQSSKMFKKCNLRYILKHYLSSNTDLVFKHNDSQYSFQNKNWIHKVIRAYVLFQFVRLPIFRPTEQPVSQVVTVSSFNWWNSFTESACRKLCNFLCWSRIKHFELVNKQIFFLVLEEQLFGLMSLSWHVRCRMQQD